MKKAALAAIIGITLASAAVLAHWHRVEAAQSKTALSTSQIYIDDTPVCIMTDGDRIVAAVGECDNDPSSASPPESIPGPGSDAPEAKPFDGSPSGNLPPGHPPIGPDFGAEGQGPVLI